MCPECNGAGKVLSKCNHQRNCQCCKNGRIEWIQETRFSYFAQVLPVTYNRFKSYQVVLEQLIVQLSRDRNIAILAVQEKLEREECKSL